MEFILDTSTEFLFNRDSSFAYFLLRQPRVATRPEICRQLTLGAKLNISASYLVYVANHLPALEIFLLELENFVRSDPYSKLHQKPCSMLTSHERMQLPSSDLENVRIHEALINLKSKCTHLISIGLLNASYADPELVWRLVADGKIQALDLRGSDVGLPQLNNRIITTDRGTKYLVRFKFSRCRYRRSFSVRNFIQRVFTGAYANEEYRHLLEAFKSEWKA